MFNTSEISSEKALTSKKKLEALNPDVRFELYTQKLTKVNYKHLIAKPDFLVDPGDNAKAKFLVNDIGLEYNIPVTIAGVRRSGKPGPVSNTA